VIAHSEALRIAGKMALKMRAAKGYSLGRPCDVYDLIFHSGIELQFFAVPTLEGMYLEDGKTRRICVSAFRPAGRQRFTAAHELGHSTLQHGTRLDSVKEFRERAMEIDCDERSADTFASCLLMPSSAVHSGFRLRNLDIQKPTPLDVYRVAAWLGVGYSTLCNYMSYSMKTLSSPRLKQLLHRELRTIKSELAQQETAKDVFELDALWAGESVHGQVGDLFNGLASVSSGALIQIRHGTFLAGTPGEATCSLISGGAVLIRISRENYVGFYDYRYMPEEE
jgi:Zn-dependent peptidase ImmA (M78 family)